MSISSYIRNHTVLSQFEFDIVYHVIIELIKDGKMDWPVDSV